MNDFNDWDGDWDDVPYDNELAAEAEATYSDDPEIYAQWEAEERAGGR